MQSGVAGCGFRWINKGSFLVCTGLGRLNEWEPARLLRGNLLGALLRIRESRGGTSKLSPVNAALPT